MLNQNRLHDMSYNLVAASVPCRPRSIMDRVGHMTPYVTYSVVTIVIVVHTPPSARELTFSP
jgi:branched-subunit amino acid permease